MREWLRAHRPRNVLQPSLRIIAEAGWITVLYSAASVMIDKQVPILGPAEFFIFVLAGAAIGSFGRTRLDLGPVLLILSVVVGGLLGWLASPEVRELLPNIPAAASVHIAGWIAGIAVLRGAIVDTGEKAAEDVEKLLRTVPVGLALIWAYMAIAAPRVLWLSFAVGAMWGTVAFLASAVVSIGLARLNVLHSGVTDERQRRAWRWLVIAIGFVIVPIAVPIGVLSGIPLAAMVTPVVGPLQFLLGLLAYPLMGIVWVLTQIFSPIAGPLGAFLDELQKRLAAKPTPDPQEASTMGTLIGLALWIFTIFLVLLAIFYFARWLLNRKRGYDPDLDPASLDTERSIVMPAVPTKPASHRRFRRRGAPHDVVAAYMSALAELDSRADMARLPNETPAQHARRLRRVSGVDPALAADFARLAAGYQLARYGERRITTLENVRAVGRFQRLRRMLRASTA